MRALSALCVLFTATVATAAPWSNPAARVCYGGVLRPAQAAKHENRAANMRNVILNLTGSHYHPDQPGDTPGWALAPASGTAGKLTYIRGQDFAHESSKDGHPAMEVTNLPKGGILRLHGLIPVSGHVRANEKGKLLSKNETAELFGKTNRYNIIVTHPDGKVEEIKEIVSQGLVTGVALAIQLQKGKTLVQFYPKGSYGVGAYSNGRTIELRYAGKDGE